MCYNIFKHKIHGGNRMKKTAGMLMPISSLPSPYGVGTLGSAAYRFIDFLRGAGCSLWQVLPLQPTSYGDSPYSSCSANALNPYFIDFDLLRKEGILEREDYVGLDWGDDPRRVDYGKLYRLRESVLRKAFARFDRADGKWKFFLREGKYRDFALFMSVKQLYGGAPFREWGEYARYDEEKMRAFEREHREDVEFWQFTQFLFLRQWSRLKEYANAHGVEIMGDIPFYVAEDSVELWKYGKELFLVDEEGVPTVQAGVPPDAFSETGQLWGNPVYNWAKMRANGYFWWHRRIDDALALYDVLRIDHFIGFSRYYCIPAGEKDARHGEYRKGPGAELFRGYENRRIVAEDLGLVTDEVREMVYDTGYPGMKILQHAFDGNPDNEHKPSNYEENYYAYTGTHDNETFFSRFSGTTGEARERLILDMRQECLVAGVSPRTHNDRALCLTALRLLYASKARTVVFPLQDALFMGNEGRINLPATVSPENWSVRFLRSDFSAPLRQRLRGLAVESGRCRHDLMFI